AAAGPNYCVETPSDTVGPVILVIFMRAADSLKRQCKGSLLFEARALIKREQPIAPRNRMVIARQGFKQIVHRMRANTRQIGGTLGTPRLPRPQMVVIMCQCPDGGGGVKPVLPLIVAPFWLRPRGEPQRPRLRASFPK